MDIFIIVYVAERTIIYFRFLFMLNVICKCRLTDYINLVKDLSFCFWHLCKLNINFTGREMTFAHMDRGTRPSRFKIDIDQQYNERLSVTCDEMNMRPISQ